MAESPVSTSIYCGGTARVRARGLSIMVIDTFLMGLGFYALVPLLAYHFLHDLLLTVTLTGVLAGIRSASQQATMFWSGMVADRLGYRRAICVGVLLRAAGFAGFGVVSSTAGLVIASVLAGIGGSLFHPASYALYAELTPPADRTRAYGIREMASNIAFALGPAAGGLLASTDFTVLCFAAAALFLLAGVVTWFGVRPDRPHRSAEDKPSRPGAVLRDRAFVRLILVNGAAWALFSQLYLAVPLRIGQLFTGPTALGIVYTYAAAVTVTATIPLTRLAERRLGARATLATSAAALAAGLLLLGVLPGAAGLLIGLTLFVLGQVLFLPTVNGVVSKLAPPNAVASYFGANGVALSIGAVAGSVGGGRLLDIDTIPGWSPWLAFAAWGIATAAAYLLVADRRPGT